MPWTNERRVGSSRRSSFPGDTAGHVDDIMAGSFCHPAIKNDSSAILATGNDVEDHVPELSAESVGKFGRLVSMLLIPAKSARQATCHLGCRSTHQLADVLRDRGRAHPSLPELSQLLRDAMGACSQFMKHAREGKVALP